MAQKLLPKGIYTPLPTFFLPNEDLDIDSMRKHVVYVARAGTIPVISGSAGEAPHLTCAERIQLTIVARNALDQEGLHDVPLVVGIGTPSTRETISLAKSVAEAGADFAMVLPPGYYAGQLTQKKGELLEQYFVDVAEESPIPVIVYNFPAVSSGIDITSDMVLEVMRKTDNVVGVKLTCANVGKISRITAVLQSPDFQNKYPRRQRAQEFQVIDGYIDILLPSVSVGAAGAISGLPNIAPKVCVRLWQLASMEAPPGSEPHSEARRLQRLLSMADGVAASIGIAGLKMMVSKTFGYSASPRRPLRSMSSANGDAVMNNPYISAVLQEEQRLREES